MHSYSRLAVVSTCWVQFALPKKVVMLAREGRTRATLSLLGFKHLMQESALRVLLLPGRLYGHWRDVGFFKGSPRNGCDLE